MKEITATDAARGFSALLDAVEHDGETFVVTRGGRGIARIEAAAGASGAAVRALLRRHRVDPTWADEVREVRTSASVQERAWPA
jgi:antitoxin (DNA-binding transcriptional repressor) of toxin-antitoxin stability system